MLPQAIKDVKLFLLLDFLFVVLSSLEFCFVGDLVLAKAMLLLDCGIAALNPSQARAANGTLQRGEYTEPGEEMDTRLRNYGLSSGRPGSLYGTRGLPVLTTPDSHLHSNSRARSRLHRNYV